MVKCVVKLGIWSDVPPKFLFPSFFKLSIDWEVDSLHLYVLQPDTQQHIIIPAFELPHLTVMSVIMGYKDLREFNGDGGWG